MTNRQIWGIALLLLLSPLLTSCGTEGKAEIPIMIKKAPKTHPMMKAEVSKPMPKGKSKHSCAMALDEAYDMAGAAEALSDEAYLASSEKEMVEKSLELTQESSKVRMAIKNAIRLCY